MALLLAGLQPAPAANQFLPTEEAFRLSVRPVQPTTLEVRFDIAPGYYMYRERLRFEATPSDIKLTPVVPPGKIKYDTTFEKDVETYRDQLIVPLGFQGSGSYKLSITSQGCADRGLCYPPRTDEFRIDAAGAGLVQVAQLSEEQAAAWTPTAAAPGAAAAAIAAATGGTAAPDVPAAAAAAGGTARAEPTQIESALKSGSLLTIFAVFLLAGVLLSFTPCVLPMVPILSSIIVGQGTAVSRGRGLALAASYSLGMALVYTALGVAAGLLGEGLAAALQNPWVLGAFALLLAGLSLSMFGFYELQMPSFIQTKVSEQSNRLRGGRLAGVFAMGGLSALIVGPCVAAPLAASLVYISQTRDVLIGGLALFSLAMGMSVPLLMVGASAGSLLPRVGAWMESVKRLFGVLLLAVAVWMVSPVVPGAVVMLMWGALLLVCAVYLHVFDRLPDAAPGWNRFFKGVGVLLAVVGMAQVLGALSGGSDALQPLAHLASGVRPGSTAAAQGGASHAGVTFRRIRTNAELDAAVQSAGRPVMLDFYADWCVSCKEFERFTFREPKVQEKLAGMLLLQVDVTANNADDKALLKRFGLFGPPGIVFFDARGQEQPRRVIGYEPSDKFLQSLSEAGV